MSLEPKSEVKVFVWSQPKSKVSQYALQALQAEKFGFAR